MGIELNPEALAFTPQWSLAMAASQLTPDIQASSILLAENDHTAVFKNHSQTPPTLLEIRLKRPRDQSRHDTGWGHGHGHEFLPINTNSKKPPRPTIARGDVYQERSAREARNHLIRGVDGTFVLMQRGRSTTGHVNGYYSTELKEYREGLKKGGLFPTGPPDNPDWEKLITPPEMARKAVAAECWSHIDFKILSRDPMYAQLVAGFVNDFPELLDIKLLLPTSRSPYGPTLFPNLLDLPEPILLFQESFEKKVTKSWTGPRTIKVVYAHPVIELYKTIWNLHCTQRESNLRMGKFNVGLRYETDWNWASGHYPQIAKEGFPDALPGIAETHGVAVARAYGTLLQRFYKMPKAIGLQTKTRSINPKPTAAHEAWYH